MRKRIPLTKQDTAMLLDCSRAMRAITNKVLSCFPAMGISLMPLAVLKQEATLNREAQLDQLVDVTTQAYRQQGIKNAKIDVVMTVMVASEHELLNVELGIPMSPLSGLSPAGVDEFCDEVARQIRDQIKQPSKAHYV